MLKDKDISSKMGNLGIHRRFAQTHLRELEWPTSQDLAPIKSHIIHGGGGSVPCWVMEEVPTQTTKRNGSRPCGLQTGLLRLRPVKGYTAD